MSPAADTVIRGGLVVDGTGAPPRTGDIAVKDGVITSAEGRFAGTGAREVDADGAVVAPGWVDIHTHYDGQVTWDPEVTPSSWHGVTTVVMGNCGVGFAPVRPEGRDFLVEVMEGVEDIPGTALHEGIDWTWETFPEYLDAVGSTERVLDVAAQVPHAALRAYVMGERAHEAPTPEEVGEMARLTEEALRAGAVGVSSSRTIFHKSKHGLVPGTEAIADELRALGDAMGRAGHGVLEVVFDGLDGQEEHEWMVDVARRSGRPVTFALVQFRDDPDAWKGALARVDGYLAEGLPVVPQVPCRPTGMLFGLESSLHPFLTHPTYRAIASQPLAERVAALRTPEVRDRLVAEGPATRSESAKDLMGRWEQIFPLGDPPDYEPPASKSVAAVAAATGRSPQAVVLDWLLEQDGRALLFAPLTTYVDHDFEVVRALVEHPGSVLGLSDGGAHCGLICDVSMPTYLLTHWVRDRTRGPRIPLEAAVAKQTSQTAALYGFGDRGVLAPGRRADVNVIDLDGLTLHAPEMVYDLPASGRRLVQRADGYLMTLCAGEVTLEDGVLTGARPGRLVRGSP